MYGVKEASKVLGISQPMVRYYARKGALKCQRVIGGTGVVFLKEHIDEFLADISGLTTMDVAVMCGVTPAVVGNWVNREQLPARRCVINEWRFTEADVRKFAEERGIQIQPLDVRKTA